MVIRHQSLWQTRVNSQQKPPGGVRPVNRISAAPSLSGNRPYRDPPVKLHGDKTLKLQENGENVGREPPSKRQRVSSKHTTSAGSSSTTSDDLVDKSAGNSGRLEASATRSGNSYKRNTMRRGVKEGQASGSNHIEKTLGLVRKRNRTSGSSERPITNGSRSFLKDGAGQTVASNGGEVEWDPISNSDGDLEVTQVKPVKPDIEVQIFSASPEWYHGTAQLKPPRPKPGSNEKLHPGMANTPLASNYFPSNDRRRRDSTSPHLAADSSPERNSARRQASFPVRKTGKSASEAQLVDDGSGDELANDSLDFVDGKHHRPAQHSADARKGQLDRDFSNNLRGGLERGPSVHRKEESESYNARVDIYPTGFGTSKKGKAKVLVSGEKYNVLQIFSPSRIWLAGPNKKLWSLHQNTNGATLEFLDERGEPVQGLTLMLVSINKIIRAKSNSKLIIHKSRDQTADNSDKICVELSDRDETSTFIQKLEESTSRINVVGKEE